MNLSQRLAAAARRRDGEDEIEPPAPAPVPSPAPTVDVRVILHGTTPVAAVDPDPEAEAGSLCPSCHRHGQVGLVDIPRQITDYHCAACGAMWSSRPIGAAPGVTRPTSFLPPTRGQSLEPGGGPVRP